MTPPPLQDMYVDFNKAQETAGHIKGIQQWITNEFMHSGAAPSCCHVTTPDYGSRCCHRPVSYKQSVLANLLMCCHVFAWLCRRRPRRRLPHPGAATGHGPRLHAHLRVKLWRIRPSYIGLDSHSSGDARGT